MAKEKGRQRNPLSDQLKRALKRLLNRPEPDPSEDPYAYVGAPKKPRPPVRSGAVAVHPDE